MVQSEPTSAVRFVKIERNSDTCWLRFTEWAKRPFIYLLILLSAPQRLAFSFFSCQLKSLFSHLPPKCCIGAFVELTPASGVSLARAGLPCRTRRCQWRHGVLTKFISWRGAAFLHKLCGWWPLTRLVTRTPPARHLSRLFTPVIFQANTNRWPTLSQKVGGRGGFQ